MLNLERIKETPKEKYFISTEQNYFFVMQICKSQAPLQVTWDSVIRAETSWTWWMMLLIAILMVITKASPMELTFSIPVSPTVQT